MPPKESSILDNVYFGVPIGEGGYEYHPIDHIEHIDITDTSSMLPHIGEDMYSHFIRVKGGTRLIWVSFTEAIWHKNLLYLKFPKKGRRKLKRYKRRLKWQRKI